jgi:hypothetical protein
LHAQAIFRDDILGEGKSLYKEKVDNERPFDTNRFCIRVNTGEGVREITPWRNEERSSRHREPRVTENLEES